MSLLLKSLKKLLKSSHITTFSLTKATMQSTKKVYGNTNKLRLYISQTRWVSYLKESVRLPPDSKIILTSQLTLYYTHPDYETLLEIERKRDAKLKNYILGNPAISKPLYDLRVFKSLIIYLRLVLNIRCKFIANIILKALKSKEIIYTRSIQIAIAYMTDI